MSDNDELNERLEKGDAVEMAKALNGFLNEVPQEREKEKKIFLSGGRTQWVSGDGIRFSGAGKTTKTLPPGLYDIDFSPEMGLYFEKLTIKIEDLLDFPHTNTAKVLREIKSFWKLADRFAEYGVAHKRGILLWGPPGSGKSCTVAQVIADVVERGGIAVRFFHPKVFEDGMKVFRGIQPETPMVVVMEDLDALVQNVRESDILNILDGVGLVTHTVFLATTNYPELLGERIVNRPSRFDKRFKIPPPTPKARRIYFEHLIRPERVKELGIDLDRWVADTDGLSLAHLKELFTATILIGDPYEEAVANIQSMKEKISSEGDREMVGFAGAKKIGKAGLTG